MPELPDVEVERRYLQSTALHRPVAEVHVDRERILDGTTPQALGRRLNGRRFQEARRHGKHLFVGTDDESWLHLHFGMTGTLQFRERDEVEPHARARFVFEDGASLQFVNPRLLGGVSVVPSIERFVREHDLGPDVLELTREEFGELVAGRRGMIKTTLMDQSTMAGIGNVYSDEILYHEGIHPKLGTDALDDDALKSLHARTVEVLETAVDAQVDVERMPDDWLLPRREEGADCPRCGGEIVKLDVSGRSAYLCPSCQPAP